MNPTHDNGRDRTLRSNPGPDDSGDARRLRWRCRRGMRELDVLLESFLNHDYPSLPDPARDAFSRFLELSDPEILDFVLGRQAPADPMFRGIVERLAGSRTRLRP